MAKPKPKRIPSDSCRLFVDGEECHPHEGEWVELISAETVAEMRARVAMSRLDTQIDAIRGEPNEAQQYITLMDDHYTQLVGFLAERVFAWDWTDLRGRPLPPPVDEAGSPLGLLRLHPAELYWLSNVSTAESPEQRKNA